MSDSANLYRGVLDLLKAIANGSGINNLTKKGYLINQIAIFLTEAENANYIEFDDNDVPIIADGGQILLVSSSDKSDRKFVIEELEEMKIPNIDKDDIYLPSSSGSLK